MRGTLTALSLALAIALAGGLGLGAPATAQDRLLAAPHCIGPLACGADAEMAELLEHKMADHLWYGLSLPIDYGTADRIPGDVTRIGPAWGDAGLWSGAYLGAESYRYALAKAKVTGGEQPGRWKKEQAAAKARIDDLLSQIDLRTNIARPGRPVSRPLSARAPRRPSALAVAWWPGRRGC